MTTRPPIGSRRTITVGEDKLTTEERATVDALRVAVNLYKTGHLQVNHLTPNERTLALVERLAPEPPLKTLETIGPGEALDAWRADKPIWQDGHRVESCGSKFTSSHITWPLTSHYEIEVDP